MSACTASLKYRVKTWQKITIIVFVPLCFSPLSLPPSVQSKDGKTPLHMAATHGRFSCSQALIQNGETLSSMLHAWIQINVAQYAKLSGFFSLSRNTYTLCLRVCVCVCVCRSWYWLWGQEQKRCHSHRCPLWPWAHPHSTHQTRSQHSQVSNNWHLHSTTCLSSHYNQCFSNKKHK